MLYFACPARTHWRVRSCRYAAPLSFFSSFLGFPARTHSRYSSMSLRAMYLSFIGFLSIHEHPPSCQHAMPLHIGEAIGHEDVGFHCSRQRTPDALKEATSMFMLACRQVLEMTPPFTPYLPLARIHALGCLSPW